MVEAAHTVLKSKLETVRDFVSLQRAHREMLSTLRAKFFLDNLDISQVLLWQIDAFPSFAGRCDHTSLRIIQKWLCTRYVLDCLRVMLRHLSDKTLVELCDKFPATNSQTRHCSIRMRQKYFLPFSVCCIHVNNACPSVYGMRCPCRHCSARSCLWKHET